MAATGSEVRQNQLAFRAIKELTLDLSRVFGERQRSMALFARLIQHVKDDNLEAITRINGVFIEFISANFDAILATDYTKFQKKRVVYSDRLFIDFSHLFVGAPADVTKVIWQHLLIISTLLFRDKNPDEIRAKIKALNEKRGAGDIVGTLISKLSQKFGDTPTATGSTEAPKRGGEMKEGDIMAKAIEVISSGDINELIEEMGKGVESGELDQTTLMTAAMSMLSADDPVQAAKAKNMVDSLQSGGLGSMIAKMAMQ